MFIDKPVSKDEIRLEIVSETPESDDDNDQHNSTFTADIMKEIFSKRHFPFNKLEFMPWYQVEVLIPNENQ